MSQCIEMVEHLTRRDYLKEIDSARKWSRSTTWALFHLFQIQVLLKNCLKILVKYFNNISLLSTPSSSLIYPRHESLLLRIVLTLLLSFFLVYFKLWYTDNCFWWSFVSLLCKEA